MAIFAKKNPIEKLRGEIAALEARRAALAEQRTAAAAGLDAARGLARDALIAGDNSFDDAAVVSAERRLAAIDDALAEIGRRLEDAGAALAEQEDTKAREAEAASREKAAADVEKAAARIDDIVVTLAGEFDALRHAIPDCVEARMRDEIFGDGPLLFGDKLAAQIVADAMNKHMGSIFEREREKLGGFERANLRLLFRKPDSSLAAVHFFAYPDPPALTAQESASDLVVEPLTNSAARIRDGDDPADAPAPRDVAPPSSRHAYNFAMLDAIEKRNTQREATPQTLGRKLDVSGIIIPRTAK